MEPIATALRIGLQALRFGQFPGPVGVAKGLEPGDVAFTIFFTDVGAV